MKIAHPYTARIDTRLTLPKPTGRPLVSLNAPGAIGSPRVESDWTRGLSPQAAGSTESSAFPESWRAYRGVATDRQREL
jgi:hypothetical protein